MEIEAFRKLHPAEFYRKFLVHSVRPDGRNLSKARKTTITAGTPPPPRSSIYFAVFCFFFVVVFSWLFAFNIYNILFLLLFDCRP